MQFQRYLIALCIASALCLPACIMTKNPHYQTQSSYLDARYDQLLYLHRQNRLTKADYDEAYLLGTMYRDKNKLAEARNLFKISFDNQHTLPSGVAYISVLEELGEQQEAHNVHEFLTMIYAENEIQNQTKILDSK